MCMDADTEKRVDIDCMIGYAVARKKGGSYIPVFNTTYIYDKGVRCKATYYGDRNNMYEKIPVRKNSTMGGFYFFHSKRAAENLASTQGRCENFIYVVIRCEFEEVFEKGKWNGFVAYRAKFRTILEDV